MSKNLLALSHPLKKHSLPSFSFLGTQSAAILNWGIEVPLDCPFRLPQKKIIYNFSTQAKSQINTESTSILQITVTPDSWSSVQVICVMQSSPISILQVKGWVYRLHRDLASLLQHGQASVCCFQSRKLGDVQSGNKHPSIPLHFIASKYSIWGREFSQLTMLSFWFLFAGEVLSIGCSHE